MQALDMNMIVGEAVSQGSLGVGISILIAWLRSKGWFNNKWTLPLSYAAAFFTTVGVHFVVNGDFIVTSGSDVLINLPTIHIPDLNHTFESLVLFTSNIGGQKAFALGNKMTEAVNLLAKLSTGPTVNVTVPQGPAAPTATVTQSHVVDVEKAKTE